MTALNEGVDFGVSLSVAWQHIIVSDWQTFSLEACAGHVRTVASVADGQVSRRLCRAIPVVTRARRLENGACAFKLVVVAWA